MISLEFLGLTKTEELLYQASLKIGPSNIRALAKSAGVKRSTSYYAVESLIERGFLHEKITGGVKVIEASPPEYLFDLLAKEKSFLSRKEVAILNAVPELKALATKSPLGSNVSYYEGQKNVWHIFEDILNEKSDVCWFGSFGSALEHLDFKELLDRFSKRRRQYGRTKSFVISHSHFLARKLWNLEDTDFREFRFMPEDFSTNSAMVIYGKKIALISFEKPISGTIIENVAVSQMMGLIFQMLWKTANNKP